jgi:hypothetical protein
VADGESVSLREHVEGVFGDLIERFRQRWIDHEQVHGLDRAALAEALSRTERAIELALVSHRREHEIERQALQKSDEAHELRHAQMNEVREQLDTQAGTFARQDVLTATINGIERRLAEITREQATYREEGRRENLAYRDTLRAELLATRDALQSEIAGLRESRSQGQGGADSEHARRQQSNWSTGLLVAVAFSSLAAFVSVAGFIVSLIRHP